MIRSSRQSIKKDSMTGGACDLKDSKEAPSGPADHLPQKVRAIAYGFVIPDRVRHSRITRAGIQQKVSSSKDLLTPSANHCAGSRQLVMNLRMQLRCTLSGMTGAYAIALPKRGRSTGALTPPPCHRAHSCDRSAAPAHSPVQHGRQILPACRAASSIRRSWRRLRRSARAGRCRSS